MHTGEGLSSENGPTHNVDPLSSRPMRIINFGVKLALAGLAVATFDQSVLPNDSFTQQQSGYTELQHHSSGHIASASDRLQGFKRHG